MNRNEISELYYNSTLEELTQIGGEICESVHGKDVLLRGLIEFSNYCSMDCFYCGIRKSNENTYRYRLNSQQILEIVKTGYARGLRTFVLQSGEDSFYSTEKLALIVERIKAEGNKNAAVTLSCGIKSRSQLKELKAAGVDRYLLRFETSDPELCRSLRNGSPLSERIKMLERLKEEGFQTGSGFMVGLPGETDETVINNIELARSLELDMVGVGPFIPHPDTPLKNSEQHPVELAVKATALVRIAMPETHIPATTAAGSLNPQGREMMIEAGANVLMPNITPPEAKQHYLLYPGKICLDESGIQCIGCLSMRVKPLNRELSFVRGDGLVSGAVKYV